MKTELQKEPNTWTTGQLDKYDQWLNGFVNAHKTLKKRETIICAQKKILKSKFEELSQDVVSFYKRKNYVSVPIKCERHVSSEFQDVVIATGSDYLTKKLPRKVKRYLEYLPVQKRSTTVKKFSPGKKEVTKYLTDITKTVKKLENFNAVEVVQRMFDDLQTKARKANEKKMQDARANPEYRLKVSQKKTKAPKRKARFSSSSSSSSSSKTSFKRRR
jgi:hypothetical protein